jgi:NosR/NirI family nitrous oxide reductase transcriptional regulator
VTPTAWLLGAARRLAWVALAVAVLAGSPARAQQADKDTLSPRLTPAVVQQLFPGADKVMPASGRPLALEVYASGELKGFLFSTIEVVNATGYSGTPFDLVGGMTLDGKITGAVLQKHGETILDRGVPLERMHQFISGFASASLESWRSVRPDLMRGASISGRMIKDGMQRAAERVYVTHIKGEAFQVVTEPMLDRAGFIALTGEEMLAKGSVADIKLTIREVVRLFESQGGKGSRPTQSLQSARSLDNVFVHFAVALATPASVGANLFGEAFSNLTTRQGNGVSIFMGGDGYFPIVTNSQFDLATGYRFDQLKVLQDGKEFHFTRDDYRRMTILGSVRGVLPRDNLVFFLPAAAGLDPLKPWTAVLSIPGVNAVGAAMTLEVPLPYTLPDIHKLLPPPPPKPAWVGIWEDEQIDIAILLGLLVAVTLVFVLQNVIARQRWVYNVVRVGILAFTLGWLWWWAGAQFSIINILAYVKAPFSEAPLDAFLLDPLFFILGIYIAVTLFVLGRGVFCGWLCPFGALQELSNKAAILLRVPQIKVPRAVQVKLWAVKYLAAAAILGIGLYSVEIANQSEELEPFKTAINVKFVRELPFVLYAAALLGAGLFIKRFYCRFLCPLGGALAVAGRPRVQLAGAQAAVRQPVPHLRGGLSGRRHCAHRSDQHERVLAVPRLPGRLLRRQQMPAAHRAQKAQGSAH